MGQRFVDLTVVSAKDLQSTSVFGKSQPFAVAFIDSSDKHRTRVAVDGGPNPYWNEKLNLPLNESVLQRRDALLTIEIYNKRGLGDKIIGIVLIPLADIIKDSEDGSTKFVTYQVRRPSGRTQGSLIVIPKVVGEFDEFSQNKALYPSFMDAVHPPSEDEEQYGESSFEEPAMAYPAYDSTSTSEEKQPQPSAPYPPQYPPIANSYPPPYNLAPQYPPYPASSQYVSQSYPQDPCYPASSQYVSQSYPQGPCYPPPPQYVSQSYPQGPCYPASSQYVSQSYPQVPCYPAAPYIPVVVPPQRPQKNRFGTGNLGLGAGLLGGAVGGLLLGDLISDMPFNAGGWDGF